MVDKVYVLGGTTQVNDSLTGLPGEITKDTEAEKVRLHDGENIGGVVVGGIRLTKLSSLVDVEQIWNKTTLVSVTQLSEDVGFWKSPELSKVSQLENDVGYKNGYCSYCSHCTYCQQCSRCNNVHCYQVHCLQYKCSDCTALGNCHDMNGTSYFNCKTNCNHCGDCGDDSS